MNTMSSPVSRLPRRVPVGTRYVVEGRSGGDGGLRISLRYLEFPDGTRVRLPADTSKQIRSRRGERGAAWRSPKRK